MNDLLFKWFVNKQTNTSSEHSEKIFEEITKLYTLYKHREPIVQFELSLWKMACFTNPSGTMILDPVNYVFRGGRKKTKAASRHDPLISIVITNILPFLTTDDYKIATLRADYSRNNHVSSLIVSNAGSESVNGIYANPHNTMYNDASVCMHRMNVHLQNTTQGFIHNPTLLQKQLRQRKPPVTSYYRKSIVESNVVTRRSVRKRKRTTRYETE